MGTPGIIQEVALADTTGAKPGVLAPALDALAELAATGPESTEVE